MDLITLELLQEYLVATIREMRVTMIRTAYSSIVVEGHDFGCALLDAQGSLIAQSEDSPAHVVPLTWQVREAIAHFGTDIHEGDIIIGNDPYTSGTHLNDVAMIVPCFFHGVLRAFAVVRAHWGDIGGMTPGSISGRASEIYQEGLRIPLTKVCDRGRMRTGILPLILANVRIPDEREGDFHAMMACCNTALRRLGELERRFGDELVFASIEKLIARSAERMRKALARIPPGTYRFEDYFDTDNDLGNPVLLCVALKAAGGHLYVDFEGTAPQVPSPINASLAITSVGVFVALKAMFDPKGPVNQGVFDAFTVSAPKGCVLNVQPPGAVGGFSEVRRRVTSAMMGALSRVVPENMIGDVKGTSNHTYISAAGTRTRAQTIFYEYPAGGTGAVMEHDGNHVLRAYDEGDFPTIQPAEAVELAHPLLVERCELRADSCGDGTTRGGLGIRREIRVLADDGQLSVLSDRNIIPPYGVYGGYASAPNRFRVRRGPTELEPSNIPGKVSGFRLARDDIVVIESAGGGGYGDPLERDVRHVLADVREGYVSCEHARLRYGVVVREGEVDAAATAGERERLRAARVRLRVVPAAAPTFQRGRRMCLLASADVRTLGGDGGLAELVTPLGAPLRAWLSAGADTAPGTVPLEPAACDILAIRVGDAIEVRMLGPGGVETRVSAEDR